MAQPAQADRIQPRAPRPMKDVCNHSVAWWRWVQLSGPLLARHLTVSCWASLTAWGRDPPRAARATSYFKQIRPCAHPPWRCCDGRNVRPVPVRGSHALQEAAHTGARPTLQRHGYGRRLPAPGADHPAKAHKPQHNAPAPNTQAGNAGTSGASAAAPPTTRSEASAGAPLGASLGASLCTPRCPRGRRASACPPKSNAAPGAQGGAKKRCEAMRPTRFMLHRMRAPTPARACHLHA